MSQIFSILEAVLTYSVRRRQVNTIKCVYLRRMLVLVATVNLLVATDLITVSAESTAIELIDINAAGVLVVLAVGRIELESTSAS